MRTSIIATSLLITLMHLPHAMTNADKSEQLESCINNASEVEKRLSKNKMTTDLCFSAEAKKAKKESELRPFEEKNLALGRRKWSEMGKALETCIPIAQNEEFGHCSSQLDQILRLFQKVSTVQVLTHHERKNYGASWESSLEEDKRLVKAITKKLAESKKVCTELLSHLKKKDKISQELAKTLSSHTNAKKGQEIKNDFHLNEKEEEEDEEIKQHEKLEKHKMDVKPSKKKKSKKNKKGCSISF